MPLRQLPDEEIRQTLQRAQQIAEQGQVLDQPSYESLLAASEEVGIPREAMLQALRERRLIPATSLDPGDIVFAPSEDNHLYAASVLRTSGSSVTVRFVSGGEATCAALDVQPVALLPECKVQYKYQGYGWVTARVGRYDPVVRTVHLTSAWDWQEREVPLSQVRLTPRRGLPPSPVRALLWRVAIACGAGGTLLGVLLDHLLR